MIKDGDWTLIDWDSASGRTVWHYFDGEKTHIRTDYPVTATIAENQAIRNEAGTAWKGDWHRVASVPLNIYYDQLHSAERQSDDKYVSRWLNSSDNRAWRTKSGTL
jgi:hypothetical protein